MRAHSGPWARGRLSRVRVSCLFLERIRFRHLCPLRWCSAEGNDAGGRPSPGRAVPGVEEQAAVTPAKHLGSFLGRLVLCCWGREGNEARRCLGVPTSTARAGQDSTEMRRPQGDCSLQAPEERLLETRWPESGPSSLGPGVPRHDGQFRRVP